MGPKEQKSRVIQVNASEFESWCVLLGGDGKMAERELLLKYLEEKGINLDTDKVIFVMDDRENEAMDITERLRLVRDGSSEERLKKFCRGRQKRNYYMSYCEPDCNCDKCRGKRAHVNEEMAKATINPPARNSLCPCGSGKKFKACCLRKKKQALIDRSLSK